LQPGEYTLAVRTFNNNSETSDWVFRRFIIQGPDIQQPSTTISVPAQDSTIVAPGALTFSGSAVDSGGSGFKFVRFSIRNRTLGQAYNFTNNSFTGAIGNGATSAILTNTTNSATDWSYSVNLPAGEYTIAARAIDNANNQSDWVFRRFSVQTLDTQSPSTVITSPSASTLPAGNIAFSGLSTDAGGSGFKFVRIAIRNRTLGKASGDYTLSVRTFDNAGNASAWAFQRFSVQ